MILALAVSCASESPCGDLVRSPVVAEWTYDEDANRYRPVPNRYLRSDLNRQELFCLLDTEEYFVAAHLMLSLESKVEASEIRVGPEGRVFDWNGLVMVDGERGVVPDERTKTCLRRMWREDPPTPWVCGHL
ncbi:MAG: hypothetical protein H6735_25025 [Alphaproteobacteria bacterium]|nr:hypothetical protein [Alphaproteobacteria bacterium]